MGWTSIHRTQPVKEWFASLEFKVLEVKIVHRTQLYAAIQNKDGSVFACIGLLRYSKGEWNFSYKLMSEEEHPYYYKCPKSILNKLTPTDNEYANDWRKQCIEQHEINRSRMAN